MNTCYRNWGKHIIIKLFSEAQYCFFLSLSFFFFFKIFSQVPFYFWLEPITWELGKKNASTAHIFVLISINLGDRYKNNIAMIYVKGVLPVFASGSFVVVSLTFRYLIHFEFSVYMVLQNVLRSLYNLMQKAYTLKTTKCWWKLKKMTQMER